MKTTVIVTGIAMFYLMLVFEEAYSHQSGNEIKKLRMMSETGYLHGR